MGTPVLASFSNFPRALSGLHDLIGVSWLIKRAKRARPLPETRANQLNSETQPITISVQSGGKVFLQETEIPADELIPKLQAIAKNGYDERLYVRGDRSTDYGTVMRIMGALNAAGYKKIGLVTLQEQDG